MAPSRIGKTARRIALIVVAVCAIGAVGIVVARGVSGAGFPETPIPSAKATSIARAAGAGAPAYPTADKSRLAQTPPPPVEPTPTFQAGIYQTHQGPFSNSTFAVNTEYIGEVNGYWYVVYGGTAWTDFNANQGRGALLVYDLGAGGALTSKKTYVAPDHSGWLQINSSQDATLYLSSDTSASLTFNLTTDTYS